MIIELTLNNFHETSLDDFILDQQVSACFRKTDGTYCLTPVYYTEDWDLNARRNEAGKIISALQAGGAAFAAVEGDSVIGFACVLPGRFGSHGQYLDLAALYVSKPFRRRGWGGLSLRELAALQRTPAAKKFTFRRIRQKKALPRI